MFDAILNILGSISFNTYEPWDRSTTYADPYVPGEENVAANLLTIFVVFLVIAGFTFAAYLYVPAFHVQVNHLLGH